MKVVLFARVSTNIQDYDRQINELTGLAKRNGWEIAASFAEKVLKKYQAQRKTVNVLNYCEWLNMWRLTI